MNRYVAAALCIFVFDACSTTRAVDTPSPLPIPKVVATPLFGKATVIADRAKPVGGVLPVYVSIANGTKEPVEESPNEIFLLGADGNRVPAVPLQEAIAQAGGAAGLISSVETAAAYGIPVAAAAGAFGAATGAALGGGTWTGALNGTLIGAAAGLIIGSAAGVWEAHTAAEQRAQEQIFNLSLKPGTIVAPNGTESGYVFYPIGDYQKIEAVLGDKETSQSQTVTNNLQ